MKRKIAIALLSAAIACCSAVGLAACVTDSGDTGEPFWTIETAYAEAQDLGYGGTLEEFLAQIQGEDGKDGQDGQDGQDGIGIADIYVDENGMLYVILSDGGQIECGNVRGEQGAPGVGITGAEIDSDGNLILHLSTGEPINCGKVVGSDGQEGTPGEPGRPGQPGEPGRGIQQVEINANGQLVITYSDGTSSTLDKVVGENGQNGADGTNGTDGKDGVELVIALTNETELNLGNVMGTDGNDGKDGASVTAAHIDSNGHLILTFNDEHTLDCGNVMGTDGVGLRDIAFNESGELIITMTDDSIINCGKIPVCVHQYSVWNTVLEPTCTSIGYETRTCSICNNVEYNFFEKLGHSSTEYTYNQSMHSYVCDKCGMYIQESHQYNESNECVCGYVLDYSLGLKYSLNEDKKSYSVTDIGNCIDTDLVIPSTYNNLPVTHIADQAFYYWSYSVSLTSVIIPEGVISIGSHAFFGQKNLKTVTLPESLISINQSVFADCTSLTEINYDCVNCNDLSVNNYVFSNAGINNDGIIVNIGPNVVRIPAYIFNPSYESFNLLSVVFDKNCVCKYIGEHAFNECKTLEKININDLSTLKCIGNYAFQNCSSIQELNLPAGLERIGSFTFWNCSSVTNICIPESVKDIGDYAFADCTDLQSIYFDALDCNDLTNTSYVFSNAGTTSDGVTVTIGLNVNKIPSYLFYAYESPKIINVEFNNSLCKSIGEAVFYCCDTLTDVTISSSLLSIADYAFYNCSNLTSIIIPKSIISIGEYVFEGCRGLTIYCEAKNQPEGWDEYWKDPYICPVVWDCNNNKTDKDGFMYEVINGLRYSLKNGIATIVSQPSNISNELIIPSTVTYNNLQYDVKSIGREAFYSHVNLLSIILPNSLTNIEFAAFSGCSKLKSINIPNSVTSIGACAFSGCSGITSVKFEADSPLNRIEDETFNGCSELTELTISNNIISIGKNAFTGCIKLIQVENGVNYIDEWAISCDNSLVRGNIRVGTTIIADATFMDCKNLEYITIPESITNIGVNAFYGCTALTEINFNAINCSDLDSNHNLFSEAGINNSGITVNIGSNVKILPEFLFYSSKGNNIKSVVFANDSICNTIKSFVFQNCVNLTEINLPMSITTIGSSVFYGCSNLKSITIPENVTSIESLAFFNCSSLRSITIPEKVINIGSSAFSGCVSITEINFNAINCNDFAAGDAIFSSVGVNTDGVNVKIGSSVTKIPAHLFYCPDNTLSKKIVHIEFAENSICEIIGEYAFCGCVGLTSITLPNSVTTIERSSFTSCSNLETIILSNNLSIIYDSTFSYCESLALITIPDHVTSIHDFVFNNCSSLTSITLPEGVTSIGSFVFLNCNNLTIYCEATSKPEGWDEYWNPDNCPVIWNYNNTESGDGDTEDDFYIATIDGIEYWLEGGTAIVLNNQRMLEGDIVIPPTVTYNGKNYSVTEISAQAFQSCYDITSITLPEGLITIGDSAFAYCLGITSINIPSSVTSIGNNVFTGCELLTDIFVSADNNTYCDEDGILFNVNKTILMCYPAGKTATEYAIPDSVTGIADNAFNKCISLKSITFSENGQLTTIGNYSFQGCTGLTDITIPNGVNTIGQSAFEDCTGITSITLPNSVTEIGGHAFSHCNFTSIVLPKGIETIQFNLFSYCSSLENIIIPEGVTSIGAYAFEGCENLVSVILPDSLTTIDRVAFYECTELTSITLPKNITTIGDYAFLNCINLESVYYKGTSEEWASIGIGTNNDSITNATVYYYSEVEPVEEGNYWHYDTDDMTPVIWTKETT